MSSVQITQQFRSLRLRVSAVKKSTRARGSVLLFAIILLAMLAMLGTTFIIFVRQSRMVSQTVSNNSEADQAVQAGMQHAQSALRRMVRNGVIATRDGAFDASQPGYKYTNTLFWTTLLPTPTTDMPYWHFETDPTVITGIPSAILSDPSSSFKRFTTSLLSSGGTSPLGTLDEYAQRLEIQGLTNDFFKTPILPNDPVKQLQRIGSVRGNYSVWISDFDSKLYAVPQDWGIDTTNTIDILWLPYTDSAEWENTIRGEILKFDDGNGHFLLSNDLISDELAAIPVVTGSDNRFQFRHISELSLNLTELNADPNFALARSELETNFSVYKDSPDDANLLPLKFAKDSQTAININTASIEILAAAISQIPAEDINDATNETLVIGSVRAFSIAERIVLKRPFLCRMDFEDFLAAQIKGDIDKSSDTIDFTVAGDIATPLDATIGSTNRVSFVRMIYHSIGKRWGPGYTAVPGASAAIEDQARFGVRPELTLSQYLETPGVADNDARYQMKIGTNVYWPNHPIFQRQRFAWFADDLTERNNWLSKNSLLTPKEFNNFINSITAIFVTDDVQNPVAFPGTTGLIPTMIVVSAGTNSNLETTPQGDDVLNFTTKTILAGPNGIAETWISVNRPSYYSYFNDEEYIDHYWDTMDIALGMISDPPTLVALAADPSLTNSALAAYDFTDSDEIPASTRKIPFAEKYIIERTRMYYRFPLDVSVASASVDSSESNLGQLISCRCLPLPANHNMATDRRAGFYEMSFDNWRDPIADFPKMHTTGDTFFPEAHLYASATADSGLLANGDVSWSPQFAFRSRFFGIYVLAHGTLKGWTGVEMDPDDPNLRTNLKIMGERRLEAVYDALKDQVIWQRSPVSEKHSLAEP